MATNRATLTTLMLGARRFAIAISTALLLVALPVGMANDPMSRSYAAPLTWDVIPDGTVIQSETVQANAIRIEPGATVYFSRDTTIKANYLLIEGSLVGLAAQGPGQHGPSVTLDSAYFLRVNSVVRGGAAGHGATAYSPTNATGQAGGNGGSVTLRLSAPYVVSVGNQAQLIGGRGGDGAGAVIAPNANSTYNVLAKAGDGGRGGAVRIKASSMDFLGRIALGEGGNGGHAVAILAFARTVAHAGAGGEPGPISLPAGYSPANLATSGLLTAARGGPGGNAVSSASAEETAHVCTPICQNNGGDGTTIPAERGEPGASASQPDQDGGAGGKGSYAEAIAGDGGGNCLVVEKPGDVCFSLDAGWGGTARARGSEGGMGGAGGDGARDVVDVIVAGHGGQGGEGGNAYAKGGRGGCSTTGACNSHGSARSESVGGDGGDGGDGGFGSEESIDYGCGDAGPDCFPGIPPPTLCGRPGTGGSGGSMGQRTSISHDPSQQFYGGRAGAVGDEGAQDASRCPDA